MIVSSGMIYVDFQDQQPWKEGIFWIKASAVGIGQGGWREIST